MVEFQELGGALIPGVEVNRTFQAGGLTPYTNYTFRVSNGTGPFINVTSILTEEESNKLVKFVTLMYSSWSCV